MGLLNLSDLEDFSWAAISEFYELPSKFFVFQVIKIGSRNLRIKKIFIAAYIRVNYFNINQGYKIMFIVKLMDSIL